MQNANGPLSNMITIYWGKCKVKVYAICPIKINTYTYTARKLVRKKKFQKCFHN